MNNQQNPYNPQMPQGAEMPQPVVQPPQQPMMPPPMPMQQPTGGRARWNRRLMSGVSARITALPNWFATYAVGTYMVALLGVNLIYSSYAMEWYFWLFGIVWVGGFFFLSVRYSQAWTIMKVRSSRAFEKKLFQTGLILRVVYAIFIYFFYIQMTGRPHEFAAADSADYINTAQWLARGWDGGYFGDVFSQLAETSFSDLGFPLYILLPVKLFDGDAAVFVILIINAFFGAHIAVITYRLAHRLMGDTVARMAAIFCMLHPVLICYVGVTLKEIIMTWLFMLFVDMADRMLIGKKYSFATVAPVVLSGFLLFMFRTVLGMVAFMAVFFSLVMIDSKLVGYGKKIVLGIVLAGAVLFAASDNIMKEVDKIRQTDLQQEQQTSMTKRYGSEKGGAEGGNKLADYAGAAVFAPMIFTIPFPTMVETYRQEDIRLIHGGNWMRNVMSGFVILAMFMLLLTGDWRKHTLMIAAMLGYMVVLVFSSFAHSLRFHIPTMPIEMIFAAYAIVNMKKKHQNWYLIWCLLCIVMCFGWNWFKLAGRGLA